MQGTSPDLQTGTHDTREEGREGKGTPWHLKARVQGTQESDEAGTSCRRDPSGWGGGGACHVVGGTSTRCRLQGDVDLQVPSIQPCVSQVGVYVDSSEFGLRPGCSVVFTLHVAGVWIAPGRLLSDVDAWG